MFSRGVVCVLLVTVCIAVSNACEPCSCLYYLYTRAQCSFNTIDKVLPQIPDTLPANTSVLEMNHQPLKSLEAHTFTKAKLSLLQRIELEYSVIKSIDKDAFSGVYDLSKISLSNNEIASLNPNTFATNKNLSDVDLGFNKLTVIRNGLFSNISTLKSVDLQRNLIRYVEEYAFYNNPELFRINLQYNQLQMIEASMVDRLKALTHLLIHNNDWICHCGLRKLRDLMENRYLYYRSSPKCSKPVSVSYKNWDTLTSNKFVCWLKVYTRPDITNRTIYDEAVQLNCTFDGNPDVHTILWTYHGNENTSKADKYKIQNYYDRRAEVNRTYLDIEKLTPADSGAYTCTGSNYEGSANLTYYLTVITGKPPVINIPAEPVIEVDEGTNNFTLPCKVFGIPKPTLFWREMQYNVRTGSNHIIYEEDAEQDHYWYNLTLTQVHQGSGANYTCIGSNSKGVDSKAVQIIVRYSPAVRIGYEVYEDRKQAVVSCIVQAYPTPTIKWQQNKADINTQSSQKYSITTSQDQKQANTINSLLHIDDLLPSDIGMYQCVAENSVGSKLGSTYLSYTHVPIIALPKDNTIHAASINEQTTIECLATGSPSDMYWIRNGKDLSKETGKYLLRSDSSQEYWCNLTIFAIDESDTGQYQCVAKNYLGFATKSVILEVAGAASGTSVAIWIVVILVIIIALVVFFTRRYYKKPQRCTLAQDAEMEQSENSMQRTEENQMQNLTLQLNLSVNSMEENNITSVNLTSVENQMQHQTVPLNQRLISDEESNTASANPISEDNQMQD